MTKLIEAEDRPRLRGLVAHDPKGGLPALFAGRRISQSFNTRVAIRASCDLLGLRPGDEILAPAYNCGSELDPFLHAGLAVRLFPVDAQTCIDPHEVARAITPRTRAVYLIHYFGFLQPETAVLRAVCDQHGLPLIEDCALSLLSGPRPAEGRAGDIALFCYYKFFPVLAGAGMVVNNPGLPDPPAFTAPAPRQLTLRPSLRMGLAMMPGGAATLGLLRQLRKKTGPDLAPDLTPDRAGYSRVLPDMPAHYYYDPALTGARISRLATWPIRSFDIAATIATRRANYTHYLRLLKDIPNARPLFPDLTPDTCPLSMPVLVPGRDHLARALQARGIGVTPWWAGYHRGLDFSGSKAARDLKDNVLSLPVHQGMGFGDVAAVIDHLRQLLA
jgi:hypothetical protein